jgi:tyrosyl-tRNA synthetase
MKSIIETLRERGFVESTTHDEPLETWFQKPGRTCYIGFDPTASSLHVGSLVPIMALAHMQRHGHRPIALVGGGTGLVGDPSGKTEMRQFLTEADVDANAQALKTQLSRFIDFSDDKSLLLNNAEWLVPLGYINFLRDIGRHFSVNRMIKAESYRIRLDSEEGLNFIEFNYMLLQAYDFLILYDRYGCCLQMGGSDQWGNIVAGIELIRRVRQEQSFGITFPLITTSAGTKMGKTAKGAVWLDADRTSPYDYFQFWINTDDRDVARFLALFTFLPMDEIRKVESLQDVDINAVKSILAFEATRIAHGETEAAKALHAAQAMFGNRPIPPHFLQSSSIPRGEEGRGEDSVPVMTLQDGVLREGVPVFKLFQMAGLAESSGASRRLIAQGGAYINGQRVDAFDRVISLEDFSGGELLLRAGKKRYKKILPETGISA